MKKTLKGFIVYQGSSMLDPSVNIVAIVTLNSSNDKTGNIPQLWILPENQSPSEVGHIAATCGNCPIKKGCYSLSFQAPTSIYHAYRRGIYPEYNNKKHKKYINNTLTRLGADGDPLAVPIDVLDSVFGTLPTLGYTHQWRLFPEYAGCMMASVESVEDAEHAQLLGYMTFRIVNDYKHKLPNEVICLYDKVGLQCRYCGLCTGDKKNVVILKHGMKKGNINV